MLFPGRPIELRYEPIDPVSNDCVSFARSLQELGLGGWLLALASFGNYSMLWMILSASICAIVMFWRSYYNQLDELEFFEWIAIYTIFSHIFMPRGVYKFYTAYYVPMILVALLGSITYYFSKKEFVAISTIVGGAIFLGFNIWLLTMARFAVPFYLFMVALFIALLGFLRADGRYIQDHRLWKKKSNLLFKEGKIII
jgi:hypothetical protein